MVKASHSAKLEEEVKELRAQLEAANAQLLQLQSQLESAQASFSSRQQTLGPHCLPNHCGMLPEMSAHLLESCPFRGHISESQLDSATSLCTCSPAPLLSRCCLLARQTWLCQLAYGLLYIAFQWCKGVRAIALDNVQNWMSYSRTIQAHRQLNRGKAT